MIEFYGYKKCSTCCKAEKALQSLNLKYTYIDITQQPPSKELLSQVQQHSNLPLTKLFNTSGTVYREMGLKNYVNTLSKSEILDLLSLNGRLIKRPIVFTPNKSSVGFKAEAFLAAWL